MKTFEFVIVKDGRLHSAVMIDAISVYEAKKQFRALPLPAGDLTVTRLTYDD